MIPHVKKGDRVLIYMPMVAQACFAILAATRIGAIHSVVFGGFASGSLATRIDDAKPVLIVSSDAGMRGGKAVPYKHLLDEAIDLAEHKPAKVLMIDRGLDKAYNKVAGRDVDYATERAKFMAAMREEIGLTSDLGFMLERVESTQRRMREAADNLLSKLAPD